LIFYRTVASAGIFLFSLSSFAGPTLADRLLSLNPANPNTTLNLTVSSATSYNVHAALIAAGWNGVTPVQATITVTGIVRTTSTSTYAFTIDGTYPTGSKIHIVINAGAYIVGMGGKGGNSTASTIGGNGSGGGPAMLIAAGTGATIDITNNGVIGGGGGGGAGAYGFSGLSGGGGGGGAGYGPGGSATTGGNGSPGTVSTGGSPGPGQVALGTPPGGAGGNLGQPGVVSSNFPGGYWSGAAGSAGAATAGKANATWLVTGTIYGAFN
jgi:hypothetical protein